MSTGDFFNMGAALVGGFFVGCAPALFCHNAHAGATVATISAVGIYLLNPSQWRFYRVPACETGTKKPRSTMFGDASNAATTQEGSEK